jgi:EAL domain-containing protein (putative c-di-GMP-specific phosphodiesterase class I)
VNVSPLELADGRLVAGIVAAVCGSGLDPARLELEVTETAMMQRPELAARMLRELHDAGIGLALDDFGIGHSSLGRLHSLPVGKLKIDRSFVSELPSSEHGAAIVRAMIALGHALDLRVVAEGVERPEQYAALCELRVDLLQGNLFSKPVPPDRIAALVRRSIRAAA